MPLSINKMTKYILVGGYPHKAADGGKAFAEELVHGINQPVKLLDCLFARSQDNWPKAFEQDKEFFSKHLPNVRFEIELANPSSFIEQVKWADAVYIRGGTNELLLVAFLKQGSDLWSALEGKTLAGSSAGANAISKYYYGLDDLTFEEGIGLLPIKTIVHWQSDYNAPNINWESAYEGMKEFGDKSLPICTLKEGEFMVLNK
jgi:peptidase E